MTDPAVPSELARTLEALLFLAPEPVSVTALADAAAVEPDEVQEALAELGETLAPGSRGLVLRELAGGWTLASAPGHEEAARRLLAKPRTPPLTPAQAETLAIVAYLQPVSRPEITRIRGVSADSAAATLLERGLVEEAGRSPFGAVLYRTTPLFLKLFGLTSAKDLPDPSAWDPTPEEEQELRERLLRAGDLRAGTPAAPAQPAFGDDPGPDDDDVPQPAPMAGEPFADAAGDAEVAVSVHLPDAAPMAGEPFAEAGDGAEVVAREGEGAPQPMTDAEPSGAAAAGEDAFDAEAELSDVSA